MARVTGIGGVFFRVKDPKATKDWYVKNLGIVPTDYGVTFEWSDEVPKGTGSTSWSTFPEDTKYFGENEQTFMVNYRVDDLDGLLETLAANGVWIDPKRDSYDFGKFAWIRDCDGNRVELWEPLS